MKQIKQILSFIPIPLLVIPLWVLPAHSSKADDSQSLVLNQAVISEYEGKLEHAQKIEKKILSLVDCIEAHNDDLQSQSDDLEVTLGNNRQQEQKLVSALKSKEAEYQYLEKNYAEMQARYQQLEAEYASYKAKEAREREEFNNCRRDAGPFDFVCDAAEGFAKLTGIIDSYESEIRDLDRRLQIAQGGLKDAEVRVSESASQLKQVQAESSEV